MVALQTPMAEKGWRPSDFELEGVDGKTYDLNSVKGANGLVIMFICNHCPYVKAILDKIIRDMKELQSYGVNAIAIMSNDVENYPDDSFENMKKLAAEKKFPFPYVLDRNQQVAKDYGAVCTPDFFGFDGNLALQYRGRLDDSGMQSKEDGVRDLFEAMREVAETGKCTQPQYSSIGCSIKWAE
ncbi:MAG: thioredoxin family protein [Alphaproteobacteria bacterium CG11_big_fil_rev_8_21_14_0_20_44_7]|nr:MAG: thioredoxin family protein [Alphaproteobacteria bacterium CG11_big_fil_rev_8_21_14_0_20_44_7]